MFLLQQVWPLWRCGKNNSSNWRKGGSGPKIPKSYGYYYDEYLTEFPYKSSVYFINVSGWREKTKYTRKLLVPKSQYQRCQGMWREILTVNALYVFLPSVTPKQVSFGLCCFNAEDLETKTSSKKIVEKFPNPRKKKSWRTLVFVGALVWRARFYRSKSSNRWVPFDPRHLVKR